MSASDTVAGSAAESPAETPGRRLSTAIYAFEHTMVVAVLLMMVVTYILTVLWNNAHLQYDQLDQLILRFAGYATPEAAPPEALATWTGIVAPLVLAVLLFGLSYLAIRTREHSTARLEAEGHRPQPLLGGLSRALGRIRSAGLRRATWAALVTAGMWGFVQLVKVLPSSLLCVVAIALLGLGLVLDFRHRGLKADAGPGTPGIHGLRARGLVGSGGGIAIGIGLAFALAPDIAGWLALGAGIAALATLVARVDDGVVGALAGIAAAVGVSGFLGAQIPGFIGLVLGAVVIIDFTGTSVASLLGGLVGGGLLLWYFLAKAGPQYDWTSGLTAILLLYVGFLGASMATHDGRHITVDAVRKIFKSHYFHLYNAIGDTVTLLFTGFLGVMAVRYLIHMKVGGDYHAPSDLSAWIAVVPIGFGFTMMVVRFSIRIAAAVGAWRRREPAPELAPELH